MKTASESDADFKQSVQNLACFTVFVDMMGVGLVLPVMPLLIERMTGASDAEAAVIAGWMLFVYAAAQAIFSPVVGRLSDRYGRRPILIFAVAGLTFNYFIMSVTDQIFVLFLGRILTGVFGATFPVAASIVSDISSADNRAQRYGFLEASAGAGLIFGPAAGGLLGAISLKLPFIVAAVLCAVNLMVVTTTVSNLHHQNKVKQSVRERGGLRVLAASGLIARGAIAFFLVDLATQALPTIWPFFARMRFGWSPAAVGLSVCIYGLGMAVTQTVLVGKLTAWIGARSSIIAGFAIGSIAYFGLAMAQTIWVAYLCIILGATATLVFPILRAELSAATPRERQGELQGALASVASTAIMCGSLIMTQIFGAFDRIPSNNSGAPFILASVLFAFSGLVLSQYYRK